MSRRADVRTDRRASVLSAAREGRAWLGQWNWLEAEHGRNCESVWRLGGGLSDRSGAEVVLLVFSDGFGVVGILSLSRLVDSEFDSGLCYTVFRRERQKTVVGR